MRLPTGSTLSVSSQLAITFRSSPGPGAPFKRVAPEGPLLIHYIYCLTIPKVPRESPSNTPPVSMILSFDIWPTRQPTVVHWSM